MADGRPFQEVKDHELQKAYQHPLKDMCNVKDIPSWVSEICSGNEMRTDGRRIKIFIRLFWPSDVGRKVGQRS